ncbi:protein RFT1 homolog [Branchiostoma floridae]|uniref:Protein RFT1 homolog n=1 Tax=Branchiostoma floridae TaxID=7739 RepID=A0A9J7L6X0_BRAFL|nr:protein RFT1 homolog [Branchiostoma floridae]
MASNKLLASATKQASYNMVLQVIFRAMTFLLNAFLLRYISKEMVGVVNVRLTLLYTTIIFVAHEAFRRACLSGGDKRNWRQTVNLIWCTVPLGFVCTGVFTAVWLYLLERPDPDVIPHYSVGVLAFAASAFIELFADQLWVMTQALLFVRLKVVIDSLWIAVRCVTTVILVVYFPHLGLIAFSIAQVVSSAALVLAYYTYFTHYIRTASPDDSFPLKKIQDFFPTWPTGKKPWTSPELARLTWSFFKQGILKQLLTEGERYVMTIFDVLSFGDQGVYDIINNLGSLAARFLFLPIEESGYLFFAQSLKRGKPIRDQDKESLGLVSRVLQSLLKVVVLIGLTILVFGYAYSFLALDIYAGEMLSSGSGPSLLRWYCVYVLLIAINGTTECFVFAAMSQEEVDRYNKKMLVFSVLFLTSAVYLTRWLGSVGFIFANCLNMLARIVHSLYFMLGYYEGSQWRPLSGLVPSRWVSAVLVVSWVVTSYSEMILCCDQGWPYGILHIAVGAVCLLVVMATIVLTERDLVSFVHEQWLSRSQQRDDKKSKQDNKATNRRQTDSKKQS